MLESVLFYPIAAVVLSLAVLVVTARSPVHSALFLAATLLSVAMLYVLQGAVLLAIIQILVYAGGIGVLYVIVVMLVSLKRPDVSLTAHGPLDKRRQSRLGFVLATIMLAEISAILVYSSTRSVVGPPGPATRTAGNPGGVGMLLYTDYLVPFVVVSMLLLAAMIGAILLAKRADT